MREISKGFVLVIFLTITIGICPKSFAQQKNKKKINVSLNLGFLKKDSTRTEFLNLGFITNIQQLRGVGINILSSIIKNNTYGVQLTGVSNIVGNNTGSFQFAGITNVNGNDATGTILSGLVNITGGNINGVVFSGLINITGKQSNGLTIGGLLNTTGGETNGVQISGLANIVGEKSNGIALSGLLNVCGKDASGLQISSLLNVTGDNTCGMQLSGLGNVGIKVKGLQMSGLNNTATDELKGVQFSALSNIAKNVNGAQIGLFNYSMGEVKGFQMGLVNYSKDTSTVKIGLVNLNPKTRVQLLAFGGNTTKANLSVRFLNKVTYTMLGAGAQYLGITDKFSLTTFYRAGIHFPLFKKFDTSGDLGFAHIECLKNKSAEIPERMYSLQARINLEYHPLKRFGIFASGGYAHTRYYRQNKTFENKPIVELGVVLF